MSKQVLLCSLVAQHLHVLWVTDAMYDFNAMLKSVCMEKGSGMCAGNFF